jgi:two-component system chemotaxis sensor kinase CheA
MSGQRKEEKKNSELQEFLIIRVNSPTKHAIVLNFVHRLEEFKRSDIELSGSQRVIRYGQSILPILSTSELLGYNNSKPEMQKDMLPVVVIQKAGALFGLEVDEIVDTLSTDCEVDTAHVRQPGIFGNLNTPEELIVAIDPFELIGKAFPESNVKPIRSANLQVVNTTTTDSLDLVPLSILLVEDTVFFRRAVAKVLTDAGHEVTMANDGKEGLDILEKHPGKFQLIISDIEMPRMNGFEFAKAIRKNATLAQLPLLALSSRADKNHTDEGLKSGYDMYLEKLRPEVLLGAISNLMISKRKTA